MKRAILSMVALAFAGSFVSVLASGCGGGDNSADIDKMKVAKPSNNPTIPPVSKADTDMTEDPKRMKGKGPGGGP